VRSGDLLVSDAARRVARLFFDPPRDAQWRPVLRAIAHLGFGTLPPELRRGYGFSFGASKRAAMRGGFAAMRLLRPLLPARYRFIAPYQQWRRRRRGRGETDSGDAMRRSLGISL
jgi:uncharacterized protein (DUF2236 family)